MRRYTRRDYQPAIASWPTYCAAASFLLFVSATTAQVMPPTITQQPSGQMVVAGDQAFFIVYTSGTEPLSYQWRRNGQNLATNANFNFYNINAVQTGDAGTYTVVVTNVAGKVTSSNAILTVVVPPTITTQPQSKSVTAGANVTF